MEFKVVIFRDDEDKNVHMCLLHDDYSPSEMPTICISDTVYKDKLTTENFYIARADFVPNRRFDGKFEVLKDFDKFDYMISNDMCFEVQNKEEESFTVHQMIRDQKFWRFVKYLADKHNMDEGFGDDKIADIMESEKEKENEVQGCKE